MAPQRRLQLWQNIDYLKRLIQEQILELKLLPSESPILCFQLPSAADALKIGKSLKDAGIFAPAIRPPTVPTSRIRISAMATHQATHIEQLVAALRNINIICN